MRGRGRRREKKMSSAIVGEGRRRGQRTTARVVVPRGRMSPVQAGRLEGRVPGGIERFPFLKKSDQILSHGQKCHLRYLPLVLKLYMRAK
jgi:hypothetical protein